MGEMGKIRHVIPGHPKARTVGAEHRVGGIIRKWFIMRGGHHLVRVVAWRIMIHPYPQAATAMGQRREIRLPGHEQRIGRGTPEAHPSVRPGLHLHIGPQPGQR